MMIATCILKVTHPAGGFDYGLHMIQITVQGSSATRRQPVDRLRAPVGKGLGASEVFGFFELACMRAQVAVANIEQCFQLAEGELLANRQRAHDPETDALVDQAVESRVIGLA